MAKATKLGVPAPRPENLEVVDSFVGEVPELASMGRSDVLDWCETIRDTAQAEGNLVSVAGLKATAEANFEGEEVPTLIESLYAEKKKGAKAVPVKKEVAKASVKSKEKPAEAEKPEKVKKEKAPPASEGTPMKFNNKTTLEVVGTEGESGRKRVTILGYPVRNFIRGVGHAIKGVENTQVLDLMTKLGLKDFHHDMKNHVVGAHMAAGRSNSDTYGPVPEFSAAEIKAIKAVMPVKVAKKED